MRRVWGERGGGGMEALRSAVAKLRRKLGDDARKPRYVIGKRALATACPSPTDREPGAFSTSGRTI